MNNPFAAINGTVRVVLYLVFGVGNVVIAYGVSKGWAGDAEVIAWNGLGAVFGIVAASNVSTDE